MHSYTPVTGYFRNLEKHTSKTKYNEKAVELCLRRDLILVSWFFFKSEVNSDELCIHGEEGTFPWPVDRKTRANYSSSFCFIAVKFV